MMLDKINTSEVKLYQIHPVYQEEYVYLNENSV